MRETDGGWRAVSKGKLVPPQRVHTYLSKAFGSNFGPARAALRCLGVWEWVSASAMLRLLRVCYGVLLLSFLASVLPTNYCAAKQSFTEFWFADDIVRILRVFHKLSLERWQLFAPQYLRCCAGFLCASFGLFVSPHLVSRSETTTCTWRAAALPSEFRTA